MKMSYGRILSVFLFFLLFSFVISGGIALGETATGVANTADGLQQAVSKWKLKMANTAHRQDVKVRESVKTKRAKGESDTVGKTYKVKGTIYGSFFWCQPKDKPGSFRYAYSYGEADPTTATTKAAHAFDAEGGSGSCSKAPKLLTVTSDNL